MRVRFGRMAGRVAVGAGSAVVAGGLLAVAYVAAGAFVLAGFLSAVFLIGEKTDVVAQVFAPIAAAAAVVFALAAWALTALGVGMFWLWRRRPVEGAPTQDGTRERGSPASAPRGENARSP